MNSAGNLEGTLVRPFGVCSVSELFFAQAQQAYPEAVDGRLSGKPPTAVDGRLSGNPPTAVLCEVLLVGAR